MNTRILIALPLAALLSLPALAQTTSSNSQPAAAPATSTDTATGKAPLAPPSREGFWGRVNPFARKNYVKRQTEPVRGGQVIELVDAVANGLGLPLHVVLARKGINPPPEAFTAGRSQRSLAGGRVRRSRRSRGRLRIRRCGLRQSRQREQGGQWQGDENAGVHDNFPPDWEFLSYPHLRPEAAGGFDFVPK